MAIVSKGKIHGRIIELDEDPDLPPGEEIEVEVRVDIERAFGGWRDDPELDHALDTIDRDRHRAHLAGI